jgi:hypothetical protein
MGKTGYYGLRNEVDQTVDAHTHTHTHTHTTEKRKTNNFFLLKNI